MSDKSAELLQAIQTRFDEIITAEAIPTDREGKDPSLFKPYAPYDTQNRYRAGLLASACSTHLAEMPTFDRLNEAVDMLHDGLNYAHHTLIQQSALLFLQESKFARTHLRLLPLERRYKNWGAPKP